ncbi:MAG: DinB family protein [Deferribacteres bacterium]|nr:DinB family protein [candidate division KSB1 bacterium]MCB9512172.1 DinB family protein [Deferribacteres bacterium]
MLKRPARGEFVDFYHTYISKVPEGDIIEILRTQCDETVALLAGIDELKADFRYAPGKWTIKEVAGHMLDTERLFSFRAMTFARNDPGPLPGMEQENYIQNGHFEQRPLADIVEEFRLQRQANILLFRSFDDEVTMRKGTASGFEFTVRALIYIVAGHERHHTLILKDRYLAG